MSSRKKTPGSRGDASDAAGLVTPNKPPPSAGRRMKSPSGKPKTAPGTAGTSGRGKAVPSAVGLHSSLVVTAPPSHKTQVFCHSEITEEVDKETEMEVRYAGVFTGPGTSAAWIVLDGPMNACTIRRRDDFGVTLAIRGRGVAPNKELRFMDVSIENDTRERKWCFSEKDGTLTPIDPNQMPGKASLDLIVGLRKNKNKDQPVGAFDQTTLVLVKRDDVARGLRWRLAANMEDLNEEKGDLALMFDEQNRESEDRLTRAKADLIRAQEEAMEAELEKQQKERDDLNHLQHTIRMAVQATELRALSAQNKAEDECRKATQRAERAEMAEEIGIGKIAQLTETLTNHTARMERAEQAEKELSAEGKELREKLKKTKDNLKAVNETLDETNKTLQDTKDALTSTDNNLKLMTQRCEFAEARLNELAADKRRMNDHMRLLKKTMSAWVESSPTTPRPMTGPRGENIAL